LKIALCQTNPVIGDFKANLQTIYRQLEQAEKAGCKLAVFPELSLSGYPPMDFLERKSFLDAHDLALAELIGRVNKTACIIGVIERRKGQGKPLYNSGFFIRNNKVCHRRRKQLLPAYDVFDETRYFEPGTASGTFSFEGINIGLTICEDIWQDSYGYAMADPLAALLEDGSNPPDLLINISSSPYYHGKISERIELFSSLCRKNSLSLLYVNQVGGQDELIFDGHSLMMDNTGTVVKLAAGLKEDMLVVESDNPGQDRITPPRDSLKLVLDALVFGVKEYMDKTGFERAVIGLSGGIDSALTAVIASLALGPENVLCVSMPSPYTSQISIDDARELADNIGCDFENIPIISLMDGYGQVLAPIFSATAEDVTEQNLQARIRGTLLMAISNKLGVMLLSTGNKSEVAVGYCTLYGDMNGGLAVIADVPKTMVYELAEFINQNQQTQEKGKIRGRKKIPQRIITRAPTAELKPDQLDQDDLPPYNILDKILAGYLEEHLTVDELVDKGFALKTVEDIIAKVKLNEYKRRQAPPCLKITSKAFGHGWRYPLAQRYEERGTRIDR
jgi:NAD+ synthetase